jgi:hypothetical protein
MAGAGEARTGAVQCPPRCLWPTSFDSQSSTQKVEVMARVGKIMENGFERMNIKKQSCLHHLQIYTIFSSNHPF